MAVAVKTHKTHDGVGMGNWAKGMQLKLGNLIAAYVNRKEMGDIRQGWVEKLHKWDGKPPMPVMAIEWPEDKPAWCFRAVVSQSQARHTAKMTFIGPEIIQHLADWSREGAHVEIHPCNWAQVEIVVFVVI